MIYFHIFSYCCPKIRTVGKRQVSNLYYSIDIYLFLIYYYSLPKNFAYYQQHMIKRQGKSFAAFFIVVKLLFYSSKSIRLDKKGAAPYWSNIAQLFFIVVK